MGIFDRMNVGPLADREEEVLPDEVPETPEDAENDNVNPDEEIPEDAELDEELDADPEDSNDGSSQEVPVSEEPQGDEEPPFDYILDAAKSYKVPDGDAPSREQMPTQEQQPDDELENDPAIKYIRNLIETEVDKRTKDIRDRQRNDSMARTISEVAKEYPKVKDPKEIQNLATKAFEIAAELGNPELAKNPSKRLLRMAAEEMYGAKKADLYEKGKRDAKRSGENKEGLNPKSSTTSKTTPKNDVSDEDALAALILQASPKGGIFNRKK